MANKPDFHALNTTSSPENMEESQNIKVYPKRWLILFLFALHSMSSFMQYFEYSVIADVITDYYQVTYEATNWTSLIFAAIFIAFSIPITYLVDVHGLRKTIIVGVIGTAVGTCLKIGAVSPDRFWLLLLGQAINAVFQISVCPLITKVAATWFGNNEIALACGLGFTGLQIGCALSFLISPSIVIKGEVEDIGRRIYILNTINAIIAVIMVPLILFFFTDKPPSPPSLAQQQSIKEQLSHSNSLWEITKILYQMKPFIIYFVLFGVNIGITWPLQILSNQVILYYYPDAAYDVGIIGLLQILFSVFGSIGISVLLDRFKKFKETCWVVHGVYLLTIVIYVATLDLGITCVYITSTVIGILIGALQTLGMEVIMELSYPVPEGVPVTYLYCWGQVVSIGLTYLCGYLLSTVSAVWANVMLIIFVGVSDLLFFTLKFDLKRRDMQEFKNNK